MADDPKYFYLKYLSNEYNEQNIDARVHAVRAFLKALIEGDFDADITVPTGCIFNAGANQLTFNYHQDRNEASTRSNLLVSDLAFIFRDIAHQYGLIVNEITSLLDILNDPKLSKMGLSTTNKEYTITATDDNEIKKVLTKTRIKNIAQSLLKALPSEEKLPAEEPIDEEVPGSQPLPYLEAPPRPRDKLPTAGVPPTRKPGIPPSGAVFPAAPTLTELYSNAEFRRSAAILRAIAIHQLNISYKIDEALWTDEVKKIFENHFEAFLLEKLTSEERERLARGDTMARNRFWREFFQLVLPDVTLAQKLTDLAEKAKVDGDSLDKAEKGEDAEALMEACANDANFDAFCKSEDFQKLKSPLELDLETGTPSYQKNFYTSLQDYIQSTSEGGTYEKHHFDRALEIINNGVNSLILFENQVEDISPEMILFLDQGKFALIFPGIPIDGDPQIFEKIFETFKNQLYLYYKAQRAFLANKYGQAALNCHWNTVDESALKELGKGSIEDFQQRVVGHITIARDISEQVPGADTEDIIAALATDYGNYDRIEEARRSFAETIKKQVCVEELWRQLDAAQRASICDYYGAQLTAEQRSGEVWYLPPQEFDHFDKFLYSERPVQVSTTQQTAEGFTREVQARSPLATVRSVQARRKQLANNLEKAKSVASKIAARTGLTKAGRKAVEETVKKLTEKGASNIAATAAGSLNPALGIAAKIAAKMLTDKKFRRNAIIAGVAAAGAALAAILSALVKAATVVGGTIGGVIGGLIGGGIGLVTTGPAGMVIGATGGFVTGAHYGANIMPWKWSDILGGGKGSKAASSVARGVGAGARDLGSRALSHSGIRPRGTGFLGKTLETARLNAWEAIFTDVGISAPLGTITISFAGTVITMLVIQAAFLANFPTSEKIGTYDPTTGKVSKYVEIKKEITNVDCPQNKCENTDFPLNPIYTITIVPKRDYIITIKDLSDTISVNFNEKKYEELGIEPAIKGDKIRTINDFENVEDGLVIQPDEKLVLTYYEQYDSTYNHSGVINKFKLEFEYQNDSESGDASAITSKGLCINDCPVGKGCWPAAGVISQLPGGGLSHANADAIDIATGGRNGDPIFAPFTGNACPGNIDSAYGDHILLKANIEGDEYVFVFGHLVSGSALTYDSCVSVIEGEILGLLNHTGNSTGPHLHYELRPGSSSRQFTLLDLVPDGHNVSLWDPVNTCYTGTQSSSTTAISSSDMDCPLDLDKTNTAMNKETFLSEIDTNFPGTFMNDDWFEYIKNESITAGWNPAVPLALGREETGWGAVGNVKVLGCLDDEDLEPDAPPKEIIDHQLACLFRNFESSTSCEQFMCQYSGDGDHPCVFNRNPNFAINLPKIYRRLTD